jgi:hypothetical protein
MRRFRPGHVWSGAGVVVNKRQVDGGESSALTSVVIPGQGTPQAGFYMAAHPARWILLGQDQAGKLHPVFVAPDVWQKHQLGDLITASEPLVHIR